MPWLLKNWLQPTKPLSFSRSRWFIQAPPSQGTRYISLFFFWNISYHTFCWHSGSMSHIYAKSYLDVGWQCPPRLRSFFRHHLSADANDHVRQLWDHGSQAQVQTSCFKTSSCIPDIASVIGIILPPQKYYWICVRFPMRALPNRCTVLISGLIDIAICGLVLRYRHAVTGAMILS